MTLEEKRQALAVKQAEINALQKELDGLEQDETQVSDFQQLIASGIEVKQINIVLNPPTGETLKASLVDSNANVYSYSTNTETTMHLTGLNAMLQHAKNDVEARRTDANLMLDLLL